MFASHVRTCWTAMTISPVAVSLPALRVRSGEGRPSVGPEGGLAGNGRPGNAFYNAEMNRRISSATDSYGRKTASTAWRILGSIHGTLCHLLWGDQIVDASD